MNCQPCYTKYKAAQCVRCNKGIVSTGSAKTSLVTCQVSWIIRVDGCSVGFSYASSSTLYTGQSLGHWSVFQTICERTILKMINDIPSPSRVRATMSSVTHVLTAASLWAVSLSALLQMKRSSVLGVTQRGEAKYVTINMELRRTRSLQFNQYSVKAILSILRLPDPFSFVTINERKTKCG